MKKIVLVQPPWKHRNRLPPLNIAGIASWLREKGDYEVKILDADVLGLNTRQTFEKIIEDVPDIVGFTVLTPSFLTVGRICELIKSHDKGIITVLGGTHPTALPHDSLQNKNFDFLVLGEGELTFLDLLNAIRDNRDYGLIDGLAYRRDGEIVINKRRELIKDIDILPPPARELVPLRSYPVSTSFGYFAGNSTTLSVGRGCPFNCTYCASKIMWHQKCRIKSAGNIAREIEEIVKKYKFSNIEIIDDIFTLYESRLYDTLKEIKKKKLKVRWNCYTRVDRINKEMLSEMKSAGCYSLMFGLESGSQKILDNINKKVTVAQMENAYVLTRQAGIKPYPNFMIGSPGESLETVNETIAFIKRLKMREVSLSITTPFPGSRLFDDIKEKIGRDINWDDFYFVNPALANEERIPVSCCDLSGKEVMELFNYASKKIFMRKEYIINRLLKIYSFKELVSIIRQGWQLVKSLFRK